MEPLFILLALVGGAMLPIQAGINSSLAREVSNPVWAALVSFFVGTVFLGSLLLVARASWPPWAIVSNLPMKYFAGGFFGAFIVFITIIAAPKLGATALLAFIVAGQMIASLIFDHYGLLEFQIHNFSWERFGGAVLLIIGVVLIQKF